MGDSKKQDPRYGTFFYWRDPIGTVSEDELGSLFAERINRTLTTSRSDESNRTSSTSESRAENVPLFLQQTNAADEGPLVIRNPDGQSMGGSGRPLVPVFAIDPLSSTTSTQRDLSSFAASSSLHRHGTSSSTFTSSGRRTIPIYATAAANDSLSRVSLASGVSGASREQLPTAHVDDVALPVMRNVPPVPLVIPTSPSLLVPGPLTPPVYGAPSGIISQLQSSPAPVVALPPSPLVLPANNPFSMSPSSPTVSSVVEQQSPASFINAAFAPQISERPMSPTHQPHNIPMVFANQAIQQNGSVSIHFVNTSAMPPLQSGVPPPPTTRAAPPSDVMNQQEQLSKSTPRTMERPPKVPSPNISSMEYHTSQIIATAGLNKTTATGRDDSKIPLLLSQSAAVGQCVSASNQEQNRVQFSHGTKQPVSASTLNQEEQQEEPVSFDLILGEKIPTQATIASQMKPSFSGYIQAHQEDTIAESNTEKSKLLSQLFRWFNFLRALATSAYAIYGSVKALDDPAYKGFDIRGLMGASIIFVCVDVIITCIQAFPKMLWIFWDVDNWDPFSKSWSIWSLVADHELILDLLPSVVILSLWFADVKANVILNIFSYRLSEISADPKVADTILNNNIKNIKDITDPQNTQFVLLILFSVTVFYTLVFHAYRISSVLVKRRNAYTLSVILLIKTILLSYNLMTDGLLLYQVLVYKGLNFLSMDNLMNCTLSVIVPSVIVTLATNVLVNIPLHYTFLRMKLAGRVDKTTGASGDSVPWKRIATAAFSKALHPLIMLVFGSFAVYSFVMLCFILKEIRNYDALTSGLQPFTKEDVFIGLVWVNVVVNYGIGVFCAAGYWAWVLFDGVVMRAVTSAPCTSRPL